MDTAGAWGEAAGRWQVGSSGAGGLNDKGAGLSREGEHGDPRVVCGPLDDGVGRSNGRDWRSVGGEAMCTPAGYAVPCSA